MESAPTAEAVYQGVYAMFNTSNMTERQKATKWLEDFQNSVRLQMKMNQRNGNLKFNTSSFSFFLHLFLFDE